MSCSSVGITRFHLKPHFVSGMLIAYLYRLLVSRHVINVIFRFARVMSFDQRVARLCIVFAYHGDAASHPSLDQKVDVLISQELKLHSVFFRRVSQLKPASYSSAPDPALICPGKLFRLKFSKSLRVFFYKQRLGAELFFSFSLRSRDCNFSGGLRNNSDNFVNEPAWLMHLCFYCGASVFWLFAALDLSQQIF